MSFTTSIIKSRNHLIRTVNGKNDGKAAWWIINVKPHKFEAFKLNIAGTVSLDDYGDVLYKGWGETVPQDILQKVEEEYS